MEPATQKGHPKGLYLLYFTEMWERFSYYGMRAIFTLYMVNALLFDKAFASEVYGSYTGLVYLTPLLGGYIADRYWGNRRAIVFGGVLMAIGQFFMFSSGSLFADVDTARLLMYAGLGFLIFGNGFFKPNISTMVGSLYRQGDNRIDSAFTIFYQGINMGALVGNIICSNIGERYDSSEAIITTAFKWGFLCAGIGMIISLIAFLLLRSKYLTTPEGEQIGLSKKAPETVADKPAQKIGAGKILMALGAFVVLFFLFYKVVGFNLIGSTIFACCIVLPAIIITEPSLTSVEKHRIWVIYIIATFVIFFWMAFEQAGASLTFFAQEQTQRKIFGWNMPASLFQVFNALFIVLLAPLFVKLWTRLAKRNKEPSSPAKQSMGLGFLSLGYLFIAWGVYGVQPWDKVSMIWLVGLYLIHTIGELCLSPIGLSMVNKLAPARFASLLMGVWFMSTATANYLAGYLSALYPEEVKISKVADADRAILDNVKANTLDTLVWKKSLDLNTPIPSASVSLDDKKVNALTLTGSSRNISVYHLKLISTVGGKINNAIVSDDGHYLYTYKKNEQKTKDGVKTEEKIEVWDLQPVKPKFLGMTISNLFDFFMIFVYLSGAAAILLFSINKWLLKRMHGIR